MEYLLPCLTAFGASLLTLFSGFGLGTLLMPAFALFFPVSMAVALTAVVHFLNNLFKLLLLGRKADRSVALGFGLAAVPAALLGAWVLTRLSGAAPWFQYELAGRSFQVTPEKAVIAFLIAAFVVLEEGPLARAAFSRRFLPLGGFLSGFMGGLSGNQGALRSAFLIKCGLSPEAFVATGVVLACLVDVPRLLVYARHFSMAGLGQNSGLLLAATASAFAGAFLGRRLLPKMTLRALKVLVSGMLLLAAVLLGAGLI